MNHIVDDESEAIRKREQQQAAIRAENKRAGRKEAISLVSQVIMCAVVAWMSFSYASWLTYDRFNPPRSILSEADYRELVEGFPVLAAYLGGSWSEDMECLTRGRLEYSRDLDADGVMDVQVEFELYGKYKGMGHQDILREPQKLESSGWRKHYGLEDLFKGHALAAKEDAIDICVHTAFLGVTVQNPSRDLSDARAEIENLLHIVRGNGES